MSESYRCAAWSPAGLSQNFGCLLTVVTTKNRVLLFDENPYSKSNWILHLDLTPSIRNIVLGDNEFETVDQIKRFHSLYVSWSQSIIIDPLLPKHAILATSNRNGEIFLWSYSRQHGIRYQMTYKSHSSNVNLLEWSSWRQLSDNQYSSYLVSSSADGKAAISLIKVEVNKSGDILSINTKTLSTWFKDIYTISTIIKLYDDKENKRMKILVGKQTELYFGIIQINKDEGIQLLGDWMIYKIPRSDIGITGAYWRNDGESINVFTFEGEELVLSVEPDQLQLNNNLSVNYTLNLQEKFKQQWMEILANDDNEDITTDSIPLVWGADTTPNNLYSAVLYTMKSTAKIHSFYDSKDETFLGFVYHPLSSNEKRLPKLCDQLRSFVKNPYFFFIRPAHSILFEQLEYLLDEDDSQYITTWIEVLDQLIDKNDNNDLSLEYSKDIKKSLYCRSNVIASQIAIYVNEATKLYKLENKTKDSINLLKMKAQNCIVANLIEAFLNYINQQDTFWKDINDEDIIQIILWCDRSLYLLMPPKSLYELAKSTYQKLQATFKKSNLFDDFNTKLQLIDSVLNDGQVMDVELKSRQKCPACLNAICVNGHIWDRCDITMQIIDTPFYRKCSKCDLKSILPKSTNPTLSDKIASIISKCVYCGSNIIDVKL
ncbi:unnamed protein product [Cunninghamella echinulata]